MRTRLDLVERDDDAGTWNLVKCIAQLALDGGDDLTKALNWIQIVIARARRNHWAAFARRSTSSG